MKLNKETIEAIAGEFTKIGEANKAIGMYLAKLNSGEITPDEVPAAKVEKKSVAKKVAPAVEEEEIEEEEEESEEITMEELESMKVKDLKELADEYGLEYNKNLRKTGMLELLQAHLEDGEEEEEAPEEADEPEEEEEGLTVEDLEEMTLKELKELATDNDIEFPKVVKKAKLVEIITEAMAGDDDEEEEEAEPEEEEEAERSTVVDTGEENDGEVDLQDLSVKELKVFADEYGLEVEAKKKSDIINEILDQLASDDDEDEDEEEEEEEAVNEIAEQLGLLDMTVEELAETLEDFELSTKGKKQALIDRIVRAVEDGTIPTEEEGN